MIILRQTDSPSGPGKVVPTYEISSLEELYPLVMEPEELANVGLKNRRHQL